MLPVKPRRSKPANGGLSFSDAEMLLVVAQREKQAPGLKRPGHPRPKSPEFNEGRKGHPIVTLNRLTPAEVDFLIAE
jgi:hypothetical protein